MPQQMYGEVNYNVEDNKSADISVLEEAEDGIALRAVKDKWNELGPLKLDDIMAHSED